MTRGGRRPCLPVRNPLCGFTFGRHGGLPPLATRLSWVRTELASRCGSASECGRMTKFQPYDPRGIISKSWRDLPHWDQPGGTYFITFRLADSLPNEPRARLAELRATNDADAFAWIDRYLD